MGNLLNIPDTALSVVLYVLLGVICALHILLCFAHGKLERIGRYVNIALHILMFFALLLSELRIETATLAYMISLFVYTLAHFSKYEYIKHREDRRRDV